MSTILLKAIRYSIFDICLHVLFSKLHNTFTQRSAVDVKELTVGMHLSIIKYKDALLFNDCEILSLHHENDLNISGKKFCMVTFSYKKNNNHDLNGIDTLCKYIPVDAPTGWEFIK